MIDHVCAGTVFDSDDGLWGADDEEEEEEKYEEDQDQHNGTNEGGDDYNDVKTQKASHHLTTWLELHPLPPSPIFYRLLFPENILYYLKVKYKRKWGPR